MKQNYYQLITLILVVIFFIQSSQRIYSQENLSADTPFIEVNGKIVKFGSAIIAFSKIRQANREFDQKTVFSQIVQQLVNEELSFCRNLFAPCMPHKWKIEMFKSLNMDKS